VTLRLRRSTVTGRNAAGTFRFQQETESEREVEQAVRAAWATDDVTEVTISVPRPDPIEVEHDPRDGQIEILLVGLSCIARELDLMRSLDPSDRDLNGPEAILVIPQMILHIRTLRSLESVARIAISDPDTQAQAALAILLDIDRRLKAGEITVEQAVNETHERLGPDFAKKALTP
jgi:hypothetical protein